MFSKLASVATQRLVDMQNVAILGALLFYIGGKPRSVKQHLE